MFVLDPLVPLVACSASIVKRDDMGGGDVGKDKINYNFVIVQVVL